MWYLVIFCQAILIWAVITINREMHLQRLKNYNLYGITAQEYSLGRSNLETVKLMIEAGIKIIQYREKDKSPGQKYSESLEIRKITAAAGVTFIVNDHVDLAMLVEADGIHIGQGDLPPERVRKLVGKVMLIGLSTHSPQQARAAVAAGVDYIGVGPIYPTQTKKDVCAPVGLQYLNYVANNIALPYVAIGGIKEHNLGEVLRQGGRCVALVTEIVGAPDLVNKVISLKQEMAIHSEDNG